MAWKVLLSWAALSLAAMAAYGEWGVVAFTLTYGIAYGGAAYRYGWRVRDLMRTKGLDNYGGFILLAAVVSVAEELYCYIIGANMAHPVLRIDLVLVLTAWGVWFST